MKQMVINYAVDLYKNVQNIPGYVTPDDKFVVVNPNGGFDVLKTDATILKGSFFGIKADLRYVDCTINATNKVICPDATPDDVGKVFVIYKAYQNVNSYGDADEIIGKTLGRQVSPYTKIIAVDGDEVTLDMELNRSDTTKGYIYTDNYVNFKRAMEFCYFQEIQELKLKEGAITGVDVYGDDNIGITGLFQNAQRGGMYIRRDVGSLTISGGAFKICNEIDYRHISNFLFRNGDFETTIKCKMLPPDEGSANPQKRNLHAIDLNHLGSAGNSRGIVNVHNQGWDKTDVNGKDAFYNHFISNSGGGFYDGTRRSQIINTDNCNVRTKNGGISCFQNDGTSVEIYPNDLHINYSNNYVGEPGRDGMGAFDAPCTWVLSGCSISSNILTIPNDIDFSLFDFEKQLVDFTVKVGNTTKKIISISHAKEAILANGIPNGTNLNVTFGIDGRNYYGHVWYGHPSIKCKGNNVTHSDTTGFFKFYSDQGTVDDTIGDISFTNSKLNRFEVDNGSSASARAKVNIFNCEITNASGIGGHLTVGNSYIDGNITCRTIKNKGGMTWNITNGTVHEEMYFSTKGESGSMLLNFIAPGAIVDIKDFTFEGAGTFPIAKNGTTNLIDTIKPRVTIAPIAAGRWGANTVINIKGADFNYSNYDLFSKENMETITWSLEDAIVYTGVKGLRPLNQPNTFKNIGCIAVSEKYMPYYGLTVKNQTNARWNQYKEYDVIVINPAESKVHVVDGVGSCLLTSFNKLKNTVSSQELLGIDSSDYHFWNRLMFHRGFITLKFKNGGKIDNYLNYGPGANNCHLRENTTFTNVVQKNIDRIDGEIVVFEIDNKQARIIEVSSSVLKHTSSQMPTRLGLQNETIYKNDGSNIHWVYVMDFADISGNYYTATKEDIQELSDTGTPTNLNTHINLPLNLSILQEKTDGTPYSAMSFEIFDVNNNPYLFTGANKFDHNRQSYGSVRPHPDFTTCFWEFTHNGDTIRAFINNRTGVITIDGILPFEMRSTDNVRILKGWTITSQNWIEK